MPPPKKAAKKVASKHAAHDDVAKDTRRAYEHLGRVEVLHASLTKSAGTEIATITRLAQQEIKAGHMRDAADLFRGAEHLSFGSLSSSGRDGTIDPGLVEAITKEFEHKMEKAEKHWSEEDDHHDALEEVYSSATSRAQMAFDKGAYRKALELARGAEALAHVNLRRPKQLGADAEQRKLTA